MTAAVYQWVLGFCLPPVYLQWCGSSKLFPPVSVLSQLHSFGHLSCILIPLIPLNFLTVHFLFLRSGSLWYTAMESILSWSVFDIHSNIALYEFLMSVIFCSVPSFCVFGFFFSFLFCFSFVLLGFCILGKLETQNFPFLFFLQHVSDACQLSHGKQNCFDAYKSIRAGFF